MSDEEFLASFESAELPFSDWTHRAHLKVAYGYLTRHPFEEALDRMRKGVQAYNAAHGVETTPTTGYHETLTVAWLRLVRSALDQFGPAASADEFFDQQTQLAEKRAILLFYSRDLIMSEEARHGFVEADLAPLPGHRGATETGTN